MPRGIPNKKPTAKKPGPKKGATKKAAPKKDKKPAVKKKAAPRKIPPKEAAPTSPAYDSAFMDTLAQRVDSLARSMAVITEARGGVSGQPPFGNDPLANVQAEIAEAISDQLFALRKAVEEQLPHQATKLLPKTMELPEDTQEVEILNTPGTIRVEVGKDTPTSNAANHEAPETPPARIPLPVPGLTPGLTTSPIDPRG